MAQGNLTESAPNYDDQMESGSEMSDSVPVRESNPNSTIPINLSSNSTGTPGGVFATEERIRTNLYLNTVKAEQRSKLLSNLGSMGVGTNRVEINQLNSRKELSKDSGRRVHEIIQEMEAKAKDAERDAKSKRWKRDRWTKDLLSHQDVPKAQVR